MFHFKNVTKAEINFHYIIFTIKFFTPLIFQLLRKYYSFWKNLFLSKKKYFTRNDSQINQADVRDRIRTCNLLIRSQTPYPLGHADTTVKRKCWKSLPFLPLSGDVNWFALAFIFMFSFQPFWWRYTFNKYALKYASSEMIITI